MQPNSQPQFDQVYKEWGLSDREKEIVHLMTKNITTQKAIAEKLSISPLTVRNHLESIYKKSGSDNKCDLIVMLFNKAISYFSEMKPYIQKTRVLVVDDDPGIGESLAEELNGNGFEAEMINDSSKVETILSSRPFDFVITDIRMPGLNGIELLQKIRDEFKDISFIVMSGHADYSLETIFDDGAISFLEKPFKIDEVFEIIAANKIENLQKRFELYFSDKSIKHELKESFQLKPSEIGFGGVFLPIDGEKILKLKMDEGDTISFQFQLDGSKELIDTTGRIQWIRQSQPGKRDGLGVEILLVLPEGSDYKIKRFVEKHNIHSFIPASK